MLKAREDAIVQAASRLLAEKGFDLMTVDQVAADVGIAKASLYKHFSSKEALAAAAMVQVLDRARTFLATLPDANPLDQLKAVVRWMTQLQLAGEMPSLPGQNSSLRATLMDNKAYLDGLMAASDRIGGWIEQAQGLLNPCRPLRCFTPCMPGPAIRCWISSRWGASTATSRLSSSCWAPVLTGW